MVKDSWRAEFDKLFNCDGVKRRIAEEGILYLTCQKKDDTCSASGDEVHGGRKQREEHRPADGELRQHDAEWKARLTAAAFLR